MAKRRHDRRWRSGHAEVVVGVAWYQPAQWAKLRKVAADPGNLENTFDEWRRAADRAVKDLIEAGVAAVRVPVEVDELVTWCQSQNRPVDGAARADFAAEKLAKGP